MYNLFLDRVQVYITTRTEIERRCEEYLKEIKVSNNLSNNSWNEFTQIVLIDLIHWFIDFCISLCLSLHLYLSTYICIYLSIYVSISSSFYHSLSLYRYIYLSLFPHSCHLFHVLSPSFSTRLLISFSLSSPSNSLFSSPHLFYLSSSSFFSFSTPLSSLLFISLILFSSIFPTLHFSHSLLFYLPSSSFFSFSST